MIQLGSLVLPDDLLWEDEFGQTPVLATKEMSINGNPVYFEQISGEGKNIDLVATEESGWLTRTQVETLASMAAQAGQIWQLEYEGRQFTVRFRHEDAPVLEMIPIIPRPNAEITDYYYGRIKLKEV